ncbi:hypothetical protein KBC40_00740 [Patescibacteria group bacterium]|nr:hypothetical protein [Patescibacteria group bacterium]
MNWKKILLFIAFFTFVLVMIFALYWVFFRTDKIDPTDPNDFSGGVIPGTDQGGPNIVPEDPEQNSGLPWQNFFDENKVSTKANGGLTAVTKLSTAEVNGLKSTENGLKYYDKSTNQFFRINAQGKPELLTDKKFYQVENIIWSDRDEKAILEYPDGMNVLYNFRTGKSVTLPVELSNFDFDASGQQITASWLGANAEDNWLVIANDDGSGMRLVEGLADKVKDVQIGYSPDNQVVAMYRKQYDLQRQEVFPITPQGQSLRSFTVQGSGFESQWSPDGASLLYSVYNQETDYLPNLWVTGGKSNNLGDLKVSLNLSTWPDKCTFGGENALYCAVPQGLPRGAGLYPDIADSYNDNFYYIDLNTGTKTLLASPVGEDGSYTAYNLFLSGDGSVLYFTDQSSGSLQSILLK